MNHKILLLTVTMAAIGFSIGVASARGVDEPSPPDRRPAICEEGMGARKNILCEKICTKDKRTGEEHCRYVPVATTNGITR